MKRGVRFALLVAILGAILAPLSACGKKEIEETSQTEEVKTYTINFVSGYDIQFSDIVSEAGKRIVLPEPTDPYKEFIGWYTDAICSEKFISNVMPSFDLTLYGRWENKTYTIKFHTLAPIEYDDLVFVPGSPTELPVPNMSGYTFEGWYVDPEYQTMYSNEFTKKASNIDVYAKWSFASNYIKCVNTLDNTIKYINVMDDNKVELDEPTYDDYVFEGWYLDNKYELEFNPEDKITQNITVYTKWSKQLHTITLEGMEDTITGYTGDSFVLPTVEKAGFTFLGWSKNKDDSKNLISSYLIAKEDVVLYPIYKQKVYTISYVTNAEQSISSSELKYEEVLQLPNPTRKCYRFLGWYYDKNYVKKATDTITFDDLTSNVVLYAKWELVSYSLTYVTGFDELEIEPSLFREDSFIYPVTPSMPGYEFEGWFLDEEFEIPFTKTIMDNNDYVLYAKWDHLEYTVSIKFHDGYIWKTTDYTGFYGDSFALPEISYRGESCTFRNYTDQDGIEYKNEVFLNDKSLEITQNWIITEANSQEFEVLVNMEGYSYIANYTGNSSNIYIPRYVVYNNDVHTISFIGAWAFNQQNTSYNESLTIAEGIDVGIFAFAESSILKIICEGDIELEDFAIEDCRYLHSIDVHGTLTLGWESLNNLQGLYVVKAKHIVTILKEDQDAVKDCPNLIEIHTDDTNIVAGGTEGGGIALNAKIVYKYDEVTDVVYDSANDFILFYDRKKDTYELIDYVGDATEITFPEYATIEREGANGKKTVEKVKYHFGQYCIQSGTVKKITINSYFENIPDYAFAINKERFDTKLTTVNLVGVKTIGEGAFKGCSRLTYFNTTESLVEIGDSAFADCISFDTFNIPASLKRIGNRAFENAGITTFDSLHIEFIGEYAFKGSMLEYVEIQGANDISFEYAFAETKCLDTVVIMNANINVSKNAFLNSSVRSIELDVNKIGYSAFKGSNVCYVILHSNVSAIEDDAFLNCYNICFITNLSSLSIERKQSAYGRLGDNADVIYTDSKASYNYIYENNGYKFVKTDSLDVVLFDYPRDEKDIAIPTSATTGSGDTITIDIIHIKDHLFENSEIESIKFTGSTTVGKCAFKNSKMLANVDFSPEKAYAIELGEEAFYGTSDLYSINLDGVSTIGKNCFSNSGLTHATITGDNVFAQGAFEGCLNLLDVTIPFAPTGWYTHIYERHIFENCPRFVHLSYSASKEETYYLKKLSKNKNYVVEYNKNTAEFVEQDNIKYMIYDNVLYVVDAYGDLLNEKLEYYFRTILFLNESITIHTKSGSKTFTSVTLIDNAFANRCNFNILIGENTIVSDTAFNNSSDIYILFAGNVDEYDEYASATLTANIKELENVEVLYFLDTSEYQENTNYWTKDGEIILYDVDPIAAVLSSSDDSFTPIKVFNHQKIEIPPHPTKTILYWYEEGNPDVHYRVGEIIQIYDDMVLTPYVVEE